MQDVLTFLDDILGPHQRHTNGEFYWSCAFCHHHKPKLAININKGAWHCWVCGKSGRRLMSLLKQLDCSKQQLAELAKILNETVWVVSNEPLTTTVSLPMEYHPLSQPINRLDYRHALKYLINRGITKDDILRYRIGYCSDGSYANRIIIPSYDENEKLNYFVGRLFYDNDDMIKYKNPMVSKDIVLFENHINWNYPLVLCEGVFDAMAIKRNAIPLLGKTIPDKLMEQIILHDVREIYLALDDDALHATSDASQELIKDDRTVKIVKLDGKDPSIIGFEHVTELIKKARPLGFVELVKLRATA